MILLKPNFSAMSRFLFLFFCLNTSMSFAQLFEWGRVFNTPGYKIATRDSSVFYLGAFTDSLNLPGNPDLFLDNFGYTNILAEFNSDGNVLNAIILPCYITSFDFDADHNLYIAGLLPDTMHLSSIWGDTVLYGDGTEKTFVAKYNQQGEFLWATSAGSGHYPVDIAVDDSGNCFVISNTNSTTYKLNQFTWEMESFPTLLFALTKFNSNGVLEWDLYTSDVSASSYCEFASTGLELDLDGNVYLVANGFGLIEATVFNNGYISESLSYSSFYSSVILKISNSGDIIWQRMLNDYYSQIFDFTAFSDGNKFAVVGSFLNSISFPGEPDDITIQTQGQATRFIATFDTSGHFLNAKNIGKDIDSFSPFEVRKSIATDLEDNIFIAGPNYLSSYLDPESEQYPISPNTDFIAKFNVTGDVLWTANSGYHSIEYAGKLATDHAGSVYLSGSFNSSFEFSPGSAESILSPLTPGYNGYLVKFGIDYFLNTQEQVDANESHIQIFPNPATNVVYISSNNPLHQEHTGFLFDFSGKLLKTFIMLNNVGTLDIGTYSPGVYFLNIDGRTIRIVKN